MREFLVFPHRAAHTVATVDLCNFHILARLRRPPAAFLTNGAITRGANGTKTFPWTYPSYMQSFIKIRGAVLEKNAHKILTLCNFNKDWRGEKVLENFDNNQFNIDLEKGYDVGLIQIPEKDRPPKPEPIAILLNKSKYINYSVF